MPRSCSCAEFTRSAALHRAAAQAGRGLPAIEAGMPLPAGTGLDRRELLARSAGLALAVYGAARLPLRSLDEGIARAATAGPGRVLVVVYLEGGADTLSILFPAADPLYAKLRPALALHPADGRPFPADDRLRWHPSAASIATLFAEGKVAAWPAVGYTHPDMSHFTSRHYYEVGALDTRLRTGWLGRYLDHAGTPDNPLQGLSMEGSLQPALASARSPVATLRSPSDYDFWIAGVWGDVQTRLYEAIGSLGSLDPGADPALAQAVGAAAHSATLRGQILPFTQQGFASPVAYPTSVLDDFPQKLAGAAAMLAAGLPLHVVTVQAPGHYDTHTEQVAGLDVPLQLTADSLLAFQRDLEARGLADRVLTLVWSEFGRRAAENGSRGTDHGAAGIGFVLGSRVRGGLYGEYPGLASLDANGNLRATADFRGVYAALLEQWLGIDAAAVLPDVKKLKRPALVL